eukprot:5873716-Prymnesium_polylepis.1
MLLLVPSRQVWERGYRANVRDFSFFQSPYSAPPSPRTPCTCCLLCTIITNDPRPPTTSGRWLKIDVVDQGPTDPGDLYIAALYWALSTMSTIAYGDIAPVTTAERMLAMGACHPPHDSRISRRCLLPSVLLRIHGSLFQAPCSRLTRSRRCDDMRHVCLRVRHHASGAFGHWVRPNDDCIQQQQGRAQPIYEPPPHAAVCENGQSPTSIVQSVLSRQAARRPCREICVLACVFRRFANT